MITSTVCEKAEIAMGHTNIAIRNLGYIAANYEEGHPIRKETEKRILSTANLAIQALLELIREDV